MNSIKQNRWSDFIEGLNVYLKLFPFIKENKLWPYLIVPSVMVFLFMMGFLLAIGLLANHLLDPWVVWLLSKISFIQPDGLGAKVLNWTGTLFSLVVGAAIYYYTYKYIVLTIFSPYFSWLSEKTEGIVNGKKHPFSFKQMVSDFFRSIKFNARNFFWEMLITIPLLLLSLIPAINILSTILLFVVSSHFIGYSIQDYYFERQKLSVNATIKRIKSKSGFNLGIGIGFNLMLLLPIIGVLFAPAFAVLGSTLYLSKQELVDK